MAFPNSTRAAALGSPEANRLLRLAQSEPPAPAAPPPTVTKPLGVGAVAAGCALFGALAVLCSAVFPASQTQGLQEGEEVVIVAEGDPNATSTTTFTTTRSSTSRTSTSTTVPRGSTTALRTSLTTTDPGPRAAATARHEGWRLACGKDVGEEACQSLPFIGVNVGGWLVMEEDLLPLEDMHDQHIGDEWAFVDHLGGPTSAEAVKAMRHHWRTFITETDLDSLKTFGITHVRVPVGYWLVDYNESDGFVPRGELYLFRLVAWLRERGMKAVLVLQAAPGGQATNTSSTGRRTWESAFFLDKELYERGKVAMDKLAKLVVHYNKNQLTQDTVVGLGLLNEPDWQYWSRSPGIRELYETMVPKLRQRLAPDECALFLSLGPMADEGIQWLQMMRDRSPVEYTGVFYDARISHAYGDDNHPGRTWDDDVDSCKTCCRDPKLLKPLVTAAIPTVVGQYSLETGFNGHPNFWGGYFRNQLSLWANTPGILGSFFWNHRSLQSENSTRGYALSLLDLIKSGGPLQSESDRSKHMEVVAAGLCPGEDLSKCPEATPGPTLWVDACAWQT